MKKDRIYTTEIIFQAEKEERKDREQTPELQNIKIQRILLMKCVAYPLWNKSVNKYQEFQEKKGSQLVLKATAGLKRVRVENKDKDISQFHNQTTGGLT